MKLTALLVLLTSTLSWAQTPTADQILAKVDANMVSETRSNKTKMTSITPQRTRPPFEMAIMAKGADVAAIEYIAPVRNKGTKMLRTGTEMKMWDPESERVSTISGHMLRDGMMGTDLSYDDMMSITTLRTAYTSTLKGTEPCGNGETCYKLELNAKTASISYPKRVMWVDTAHHIPLKQELFAASGMLLKTWEMSQVTQFGDRWYPLKMVVMDKQQQGTSTVLEISELQFDVPLAEEVFSTRWLERH